jgi:eukaryotic-like serine/threonine-protein kinase
MANKDSDDDKQDQADEQRDSDELELGKIDPLAGGYSEDDDARLVARILGEPPPPLRLADRWVLLERLGSGGMGEVHAAFDLRLDCKVAIKFLRLRDGQDKEAARQRFVREAQAMAQMRKHRQRLNVVQVYHVDAEDERVYLVMEHIDGPTLAEWQKEERSPAEIVAAYLQAGRGLAAIHAAGLVHRDFKPANVFVTVDENGVMHVAVGDLGLASATEAGGERPEGVGTESALHPAAPLTATGVQLGTVQYMAPEQLRDEKAEACSDQFAFCVSLYEALCGRRPFEEGGASPTALLEAMRRDLPAARQRNGKPLPPRIERVLRRGLSMSREDRFPDMSTLLAELTPGPRRAWPWVTAGMVTLALAVGLLVVFREPPPSCAAKAARELAGIWDPAIEGLVRMHIEKHGGTWLGRAWETLGRMLDRQADAWHRDYTALCSDLEGTESSDARDRLTAFREECLRKNHETLKQVSQTWFTPGSEPGPHPEVHLYDDAVALLALRDCSAEAARTLASPRGDVFVHAEPAQKEKLESLGAKLARIERLEREPNYEAAEALAREAKDEAKELGLEPVLAEAKFRLGHVLTYMHEHKEGGELLAEAADLAARHDMKALALDIWLYRLKHAAVDLEDTALAQRWTPVTRHALLQTGDLELQNIWHAEYEESLGLVASREGKREQAMEHHRKALEIRETLLGETEPDLVKFLRAKSLNNMANVERAAKQRDAAAQHYQEALALTREVLGTEHPEVGAVLFNLGLMASQQGVYDLAAGYLERALDIEEALAVPRIDKLLSRRRALGVNELMAYDAVNATDPKLARAHIDGAERHADAIAALHRRLEQDNPEAMRDEDRIDEHVFLAGVHDRRGNLVKALERLEAMLRIREPLQTAASCEDRARYRDDLVSAGYLLCELDRTAEARAYIEKALHPSPPCPPEDTRGIQERIQDEIARPACRP